MNEFLAFRKFITPIVIQVLFWLLILVCVIGAIIAFGQQQVGQGLVLLIIGPLMVRIYCELLIVAFRMLDAMNQIARNTGGEPQPAATQM